MEILRTFAIEHIVAIRTIHVLAAMLWAFTAITPMRFYVRPTLLAADENPEDAELKRRKDWALEQFDRVVILEHVAFVVILLTGPLLFLTGLVTLETRWFLVKMAIVMFVFIPIEIYDSWLSHVAAPAAVRRKNEDIKAYDLFRRRYVAFLAAVRPVIYISVPTVLILALARP
ncbi:hypothetical protein [Cupriavidus sp. AcVe19-1a]|uniref:hypothetical protein n=1 Tax=Cupriavidus sp. AcVe19-1a TaxID=2821359 RepID=UPI001AEB8BF1|nr:hypothetical protein [Cupriavidus sp. AcVe19-1a]MBP0630525.1 hypothetical protein [Cupriavidus sp. AcVe19-1a]